MAIIALIRVQHAELSASHPVDVGPTVELDRLKQFFPAAYTVSAQARIDGGREVLDSDGDPLGYVLQTSPQSDHLIGFSGPTNTLIAFDEDDRILGIDILSSGDTRDHVREVLEDEEVLNSYNGLSWREAAASNHVDGVSGSTLTSLAIRESIIFRLSGGRPSLRFPGPLKLADARKIFTKAAALRQHEEQPSVWLIENDQRDEIGSILRTSPYADNVIGYQGPTETLIGFNLDGRIVGIALGHSYDNEDYFPDVAADEYFLSLFNGLTLDELAELDLIEAEVEGVSGATMTSMGVSEGMLLAAQRYRESLDIPAPTPKPLLSWTLRDRGTAAVVVAGLAIALTSLRGKKILRVGFQFALIGYLGFVNGDMISQAMIVGWVQNGVPWRTAGGLVLLTIAAFFVPLTTRRNIYCTHLCPHGAVQDLMKHRLPWQLHPPRWLERKRWLIPSLLLLWCVIVPMAALSFSLVDIEPFDAWVFRIAGWATLTIAGVGLIASLFVPMAYCRYGCPTGALLNFLRFNEKSDRWSSRDWFAVALLAMAIGLWIAV